MDIATETKKTQIGYVEAVVRFKLYEGDDLGSGHPWFIYEEPGIHPDGYLASCRRDVETVNSTVHLLAESNQGHDPQQERHDD